MQPLYLYCRPLSKPSAPLSSLVSLYFLFSLDVNESICSLHLSKSAHVVVTAAINYVVACHALACDRCPAEHAARRGSGPEVCIPTECGFFFPFFSSFSLLSTLETVLLWINVTLDFVYRATFNPTAVRWLICVCMNQRKCIAERK